MSPDQGEASLDLGRAVILDCLQRHPFTRLTVSGACMEPALVPGEKVRLVPVEQAPPRPGDVVLSAAREGLRLHRLVWAPARGPWRTKADRAPTWDAAVPREDVLATAVEVEGARGRRPSRDLGRLAWSLLAVAAAHLRAACRRLHR